MSNIVYITEKKIRIGDKVWNYNLANLNDCLKEANIKSAKIILGDDITYTAVVTCSEIEVNREKALKLAKNSLPVEVDEENFDWKLVAKGKGTAFLQVIAVDKNWFETILSIFKTEKVAIEKIIPMVSVLADKVQNEKNPVVVTWNGLIKTILVVFKGLVYASGFLDEDDTRIVDYVKNKLKYEGEIKKLIFDETKLSLDGAFDLGRKNTEDEKDLSIAVPKISLVEIKQDDVSDLPVTEYGEGKNKEHKNRRAFLIGIEVLISITLLTLSGWLIYSNTKNNKLAEKKVIEVPSVTISPTTSVSPSLTPESLPSWYDFSIQVLNGSGQTGEAGKIKDSLLAEGYQKVETGNAEASQTSQIQVKSNVPVELVNSLINLFPKWKLFLGEALTENNNYDLVILLGEN